MTATDTQTDADHPHRPHLGHTMPADEQVAAYAAPIGAGTDGPVVMLNLNRYRDLAQYEDGRDAGGRTGRQVYLDYGVVAMAGLAAVGAKILWATDADVSIIGCEHDTYDEVLAIWYPSRAAFIELTQFPGYTEALDHREAALAWSALIPCVGSADATLGSPFGG